MNDGRRPGEAARPKRARCAGMGRTGIEQSRTEEAAAAHGPLEMGTASRRQSAERSD
jgi:hypothetical protein